MHELFRVVEGLQENYPLYHGTSLSGLIGIIASDSMSDDGWEQPWGVSFSRSRDIAMKYGLGAAHTRARHAGPEYPLDGGEFHIDPDVGSRGCVIEFNRVDLTKHHKIIRYLSTTTDDHNAVLDQEERLLVNGEGESASGIISAITCIYVTGGSETFERYAAFLLDHPDGAEFTKMINFVRKKLR